MADYSKKRNIVIGLLAHVDAGKTTTAEAMLYKAGVLRSPGRVDHKDTFLDTDRREKDRGITIFSKQAVFSLRKTGSPDVRTGRDGNGNPNVRRENNPLKGPERTGKQGTGEEAGEGFPAEETELRVFLLDTPGHVDFSTEMERTLSVLDYAILVISGLDGVQAHTETLWELLGRYRIPTFLWVNKMDAARMSREELLSDLRRHFTDGCIPFPEKKENYISASGKSEGVASSGNDIEASIVNEAKTVSGKTGAFGGRDGFEKSATARTPGNEPFFDEATLEEMAALEEETLEKYLEGGRLETRDIADLIRKRLLFPVFFGSALKLTGVEGLLSALRTYTIPKACPETFGARVFKITRDEGGNRLTWMKITGGILNVRTNLEYDVRKKDEETGMVSRSVLNEKITQLRIYSGTKFEPVDRAEAGMVVASLGLTETRAGQGLGGDYGGPDPVLEPVMTYRLTLPAGLDVRTAYRRLRELGEEDPLLRIAWNEQLREIQAQLMGDVQIEILEQLILDRFGWNVKIDTGRIVYKETIASPVLAAGHFEPLRHYAEVHLLMEPLPRGMGILLESAVGNDALDLNWQRLILTNLAEKKHLGVLTGSPITDIKITLIAGRAHEKHTEGGDFRQATYRAVRQGLMKAENVLLEPFYDFTLEVPSSEISRAISDMKAMSAVFDAPKDLGGSFRLTGKGPAATLQEYRKQVLSYTKGTGKLACSFAGHYPCHNTVEVLEATGYEAERDTENTADSVFCSHGAGLTVKWDKADGFMHVDPGMRIGRKNGEEGEEPEVLSVPKVRTRSLDFDERELEAIMLREFGPIKRPRYQSRPYDPTLQKQEKYEPRPLTKKDHLIVDGYNVIFAWEDLAALAKESLAAARERLSDILANYAAFRGCDVLLVFDGYKVPGNPGEKTEAGGIRVVYTKEGETADGYIERMSREIGKNENVRVATSDGLIQLTCLRTGVMRMSSRELEYEVRGALRELSALRDKTHNTRTTLGELVPELKA